MLRALLLVFLTFASAVAAQTISTNPDAPGVLTRGDKPTELQWMSIMRSQALNAVSPALTGKCATNASACTVTVPGGLSRSLADIVAQIFSGTWLAPTFQASLLGGVVADTAVDQSANINAAMAAMPASGGKLLLPCGNITVGAPLRLANNRVTLGSADNAYCSHLNASASFTTGDFLTISGVYSGVDGLAFDVLQTAAQSTTNRTAFRSSGYTVNMRGGYNFLTRASMRGCYICVEMASTGQYSIVRDVMMEYIADGTSNPGSGGIDVTNFGIGPENWIQSVYVVPNYGASVVYFPSFGIRLQNSGATHLSGNDINGAAIGLAIVPGTGQKVEATFSSDNVWDAVTTACLYVAPGGNGYVFNTTSSNDWCTATGSNANGVVISGSGSTGAAPAPFGNRPAPIMNTKWLGGIIVSTAGQAGTGWLLADTSSIDSDLIGATVAGWRFGANVASGASHYTIANSAIGNYSPFDIPAGQDASSRTNYVGINVGYGPGDWGLVHDNRLFGNSNAGMGFAATGVHNRVHDNLGYNPVGVSTLTPGPSPWTVSAGPTEADIYLNAGTVSSVTLNGQTVCTASPCQVHLSPYQIAVVTYSVAPVPTQSTH